VVCSQLQIRELWISLSIYLPSVPHGSSREATWRNLTSSPTRAEIVWTGSARLLGENRFFSIERDIDSAWRIYKALAARHLYFLKCSPLARHIWSLLVLEKINPLLACSQVLAKTIRYPSNSSGFFSCVFKFLWRSVVAAERTEENFLSCLSHTLAPTLLHTSTYPHLVPVAGWPNPQDIN